MFIQCSGRDLKIQSYLVVLLNNEISNAEHKKTISHLTKRKEMK